MLFNKEHYGKPISEELAIILRRNTNTRERAEVGLENGISSNYLSQIMGRQASISIKTSDAVIALMRLALRNASETKRLMGEDEDYLLETLEGHEVINN